MRAFSSILMAAAVLLSATAVHAQCAKVTRSGDTVTIAADTYRPMNAIAQTLANQFGIIISAEDPELMSKLDLTDTTAPSWRAAHPNSRYYSPTPWRLQVSFRVRNDGTPEDVATLLEGIVGAANAKSPFGYRLETDGEFNTFVPTRTLDSAGAVVFDRTPLLDRHIDIPAGTRTIAEDGDLLAKALSAQTGLRVSCCESLVAGVPWGRWETALFGAHDESARSVLERLIRLERETEDQPNLPARSFSFRSKVYWLVNCDPNEPRYCFIELRPVRGDSCW